MKKIIGKVSLTFSIGVLAIISLLIIALVVGLGYVGINEINSNVDVIYQSVVLETQEITEIYNEFMSIRVDTLRMLEFGYSESIVKSVEGRDQKLQPMISNYLERKDSGDREAMILNVAFTRYKEYIDTWNIVQKQLLDEEEADQTMKFKLDSTSHNVINSINSIIDYNRERAESINRASISVYERIKDNLIIISGGAFILLLLLSIIIIVLFRKSVKEVIGIYEVIATGDLTVAIDTNSKNEFGLMKKSLAKTLENFSYILKNSKENASNTAENSEALAAISQQMTAAADEVSNDIQIVAKGSNDQAEELRNIKSIMEDFSKELESVVESVDEIHMSTKETDNMITLGNGKLQDLIASTSHISESFKDVSNNVGMLNEKISEIRQITEIINSIAEQTNLLALNAAIEAARAGQAGKGFAVVADEIRKLAEQSKHSLESINDILANITLDRDRITKSTEGGMENLKAQTGVVLNTTESFKAILKNIGDMLPKIENVNTSINNLNTNKNNVVSKVDTISAIAEGNSTSAQQIAVSSEEMNASVEEVASTAQVLNEMAKNMENELSQFKVSYIDISKEADFDGIEDTTDFESNEEI